MFSASVSAHLPDLLCGSPACVSFLLLSSLSTRRSSTSSTASWRRPPWLKCSSARILRRALSWGPPPFTRRPSTWQKWSAGAPTTRTRTVRETGGASRLFSPRWRRFKCVLPVQLRSTGAIWSGWRAASVSSTLRIRTLKGRASPYPTRTPR